MLRWWLLRRLNSAADRRLLFVAAIAATPLTALDPPPSDDVYLPSTRTIVNGPGGSPNRAFTA
jgi:hypothetical protein